MSKFWEKYGIGIFFTGVGIVLGTVLTGNWDPIRMAVTWLLSSCIVTGLGRLFER